MRSRIVLCLALIFVCVSSAGKLGLGQSEVPKDWSALTIEVHPTRTEIVQGQPLEIVVSVTNRGPLAVDISRPLGDVLIELGLKWRVGDGDQVQGYGVKRSECFLGQSAILLAPGHSVREVVRLAIRSRIQKERKAGAGAHIPLTSNPGIYTIWVESHLRGWEVTSKSVQVKVQKCAEKDLEAFQAFEAAECLGKLYAQARVNHATLEAVEEFVSKWPTSPYADLGRLRLARQWLMWASLTQQDIATEVTGQSANQSLERAEGILSQIDSVHFAMPKALSEFADQVKQAREALSRPK